MSILEKFDKKTWGLFLFLYLIILFRYFVANNIPIQMDFKISILIVISFVFLFLIAVFTYFFAGAIERILLLKANEESKHKLFIDFDENVTLILYPLFCAYYVLNLGNELKTYQGILILTSFIYVVILNVLAKKYPLIKKLLYINSIGATLFFFYLIFHKFEILITSLIFLLAIVTIILYYLKSNEEFLNNELNLNLHDSILYKNFKTKYSYTYKYLNNLKMGNFTLIIFISLTFFAWDTILTKNKVSDFITKTTLNITKFGSFKEKLVIDNKLKNEFNDEAKNSTENNFTLEAYVIWENDNDIFIKYKNTSRRIKKENILSSEYLDN